MRHSRNKEKRIKSAVAVKSEELACFGGRVRRGNSEKTVQKNRRQQKVNRKQ